MLVTAGASRPRALLPTRGLGRWPSAIVADTHDPGWITTDQLKRQRGEHQTPAQIEDTRRAHIEDAYNRLMEIPAAAERIREVVTVAQPDFRVLVRNQQVVLLLTALYLEYLDEEDILLMYAATL